MAALAILAAACPAAASPFVPTDDNLVLQTGLPTGDPRMREIRVLAADLATRPDDLDVAMRLAGRQLAMGVAEADPRFVGYAQATLARWWDVTMPPALLVLRARIRQAQHDFAAAAADLHAALRSDPGNPQALLVLASVDETDGDLAEANSACDAFAAVRPGLVATACSADIAALTGGAVAARRMLDAAVTRTPSTDRAEQAWALVILGEIAARLDDPAAADDLQQAVALDGRNVYALTAYADYLLDHGRSREVVRLLTGFERIDALDLRLVLALQATGDAGFAAARDDLAARFAAARRQNDAVHLRDASRFALEVAHDPPAALDFAQRNWVTHKTPDDVRLLLAAALAAEDAAAAQPALDWIAATHLEDRRLGPLLARLKTAP